MQPRGSSSHEIEHSSSPPGPLSGIATRFMLSSYLRFMLSHEGLFASPGEAPLSMEPMEATRLWLGDPFFNSSSSGRAASK